MTIPPIRHTYASYLSFAINPSYDGQALGLELEKKKPPSRWTGALNDAPKGCVQTRLLYVFRCPIDGQDSNTQRVGKDGKCHNPQSYQPFGIGRKVLIKDYFWRTGRVRD